MQKKRKLKNREAPSYSYNTVYYIKSYVFKKHLDIVIEPSAKFKQ